MPDEYPNLEVKADRSVPDLKLIARDRPRRHRRRPSGPSGPRGRGLLPRGRPDAEGPVATRAAPDGTPTGRSTSTSSTPTTRLGLWARAGDATTNGTIVARPREGKVTLTVDPKYTVRLRGLVTDSGGRRIAGAKVSLWWTRWYPPGKEGRPTMATSSVQETYTTGENGLFVFRHLWPEDSYNVVVEARGHNKGESSKLTGKARRDP